MAGIQTGSMNPCGCNNWRYISCNGYTGELAICRNDYGHRGETALALCVANGSHPRDGMPSTVPTPVVRRRTAGAKRRGATNGTQDPEDR